jgi:hypothetical protein
MAEMIVTYNGAGVSSVRLDMYRSNIAMTHQERAMIDLVPELARFLSKDDLTVDEVMARVGRVTHDPGVPMPIELHSAIAGVRSAQLGRYPDSGLPYVLTLEPSPDTRPVVGALKAVLGNYKRALTGRGMPAELVFPPVENGLCWRVVVIVNLDRTAGELDSARIVRISFRRDPAAK